jgi:hypothetical protein
MALHLQLKRACATSIILLKAANLVTNAISLIMSGNLVSLSLPPLYAGQALKPGNDTWSTHNQVKQIFR